MKKLISIVMTVIMVLTCATVVFAESTTVLTTTVPNAEYVLSIPADQEVVFGETSTNLEIPIVKTSSGFAKGKDLKVTINYTEFTSFDVSTTIPMSIKAVYQFRDVDDTVETTNETISNGGSIYYRGSSESDRVNPTPYLPSKGKNWLMKEFYVVVTSENWGKALGGEYTATITFTSEVVIAQ